MADTSSPTTLTFTSFPKFPIELRFKIWNLIMPVGRIIEIRWKEETNEYYTHSTTPKILSICRESRRLALERFEILEFENNVEVDAYETDIYEDSVDDGSDDLDDSGEEAGGEVEGRSSDDTEDEVTSGSEVEGESTAASMDGEGEGATKKNVVQSFRTYIDYTRDTLYLFGAHLCRERHFDSEGGVKIAPALDCFLWRLVELSVASAKIQSVAIESYSAKAFAIAAPLFELENLKTITLVYGDECCKGYSQGSCYRPHPTPDLEFEGPELGENPWDTEAGWPRDQQFTIKVYDDKADEFRRNLETEVMRYKEHHDYEVSDSVEEWKDLQVVTKFIDKGRIDYSEEGLREF